MEVVWSQGEDAVGDIPIVKTELGRIVERFAPEVEEADPGLFNDVTERIGGVGVVGHGANGSIMLLYRQYSGARFHIFSAQRSVQNPVSWSYTGYLRLRELPEPVSRTQRG